MKIKQTFTVLARTASGRVASQLAVVKNILVPIDFSESSVKALRHAAALAKRDHAQLTLLNVVNEPRSFRTLDVVERERVEEQERAVQLRQLAERELPAEQKVQIEVLEGDPPQEIVRLASRQRADLIVLGQGRWLGLRRWLHGRIAARISREASCPVLLLKDTPA